jgi:hypothetical protein
MMLRQTTSSGGGENLYYGLLSCNDVLTLWVFAIVSKETITSIFRVVIGSSETWLPSASLHVVNLEDYNPVNFIYLLVFMLTVLMLFR